MEICLVRHAIATERGVPPHLEDATRPLTEDGRARFREAARGLQSLFEPQLILTSPLTRARQTAEILAEATGAAVQVLDALGAGQHGATLRAAAATKRERVALVGHEPWMSELLSLLVTGDEGTLNVAFKKGAAALVETRGPAAAASGTLAWLLQPAALRALAKAAGQHRP